MVLIYLMLLSLEQTNVNKWTPLIDSRIRRNASMLDPAVWNQEKQTGLAMQEYLMTLGQNGDATYLNRITPFLEDPVLQGTALFAYGEVDGAPIDTLLNMRDKIRPDNMLLYAEALSKLATVPDYEKVAAQWDFFTEDIRMRSLFYFWRVKTEGLTARVIQYLSGAPTSRDTGYLYYLYRSRTRIDAGLWIQLPAIFKNNNQALIYLTRIHPVESNETYRRTVKAMSTSSDWRVRVNAMNALSATGDSELTRQMGLELLSDDNPNVVQTALVALVRLRRPDVDKSIVAMRNKLTAAQAYNAISNAEGDQIKTYTRLIRGWDKDASQWKRIKWIGLQAKMGDTDSLKTLEKMINGWRWEQGDKGEKVVALQSLIATKSENLHTLIKEAFETRDPTLMAAAMNGVIAVKDDQTNLPSADELEKMATRLYENTDFHRTFLSAYKQIATPQRFEAILERLRSHPDYLVRLLALENTPNPTLAQRQSVFNKEWTHQLDPAIAELAQELITGKDEWHWELNTSLGPVTIKLHGAYAPMTCANIINLTNKGYYQDMALHRVIPNFVVQAGDNRGDGSGDPGYAIPCEINTLRFRRGSVGMALSGKDTGGGQFFICHSDQPHLDGGYTVFGNVIKGMNIADFLQEGDLIISSKVWKKEKP